MKKKNKKKKKKKKVKQYIWNHARTKREYHYRKRASEDANLEYTPARRTRRTCVSCVRLPSIFQFFDRQISYL